LQAIKEGAQSVSRHHGFDDDARGGMAVHSSRPASGACGAPVAMLVACTSENFKRARSSSRSNGSGLLQSCTAFEAYCQGIHGGVASGPRRRILSAECGVPTFHPILGGLRWRRRSKQIGTEVSTRRSSRVERIAGRMQATLAFGQIDEIMSGGLNSYLDTVRSNAHRFTLRCIKLT